MNRSIGYSLVTILIFMPEIMTYSQVSTDVSVPNPDFTEWRKRVQEISTPDGRWLGAIPSPFRIEVNVPPERKKITGIESVKAPESFDLRNEGGVSPVKNQGSCGSCWVFATMASIESRWMYSGRGLYDLSEDNLNTCHVPFLHDPCAGGNVWMSTAYLVRGSGPYAETDDPYDPGQTTVDCPSGLSPQGLVTTVWFLPTDDREMIKNYIVQYGALCTNMYYETAAFNSEDNTYYYSGDLSTNHYVTLVGWDDTKVTAGGTGAWIIKNSWGEYWGENGYFYISYEDTRINFSLTLFKDYIDYDPENSIQTYAESAWSASNFAYTGSTSTDILVKFIADESCKLTKIGSYNGDPGSLIAVEIYDEFDESSTLSGLLGSLPSQTCNYSGYYTFDLSSAINIASGEDYYIKLTYISPDDTYALVPYERVVDGYCTPTILSGVFWSKPSNSSAWNEEGTNGRDPCVYTYVSYVPEAPSVSDYQIIGSDLRFTFDNITEGAVLNVYQDTSVTFIPDREGGTNRIATGVTDEDPGTPGFQWTDMEAVGDPSTNYFYLFTTVEGTESDNSVMIGEYDYDLITTSTTDFNEISLPLDVAEITSAEDLMGAIPSCNSIARWNAVQQGYEQYIDIIPATNFAIEAGYPYYVNVSDDVVFTIVGEIVSPVVFNLITTETTDFNEVMLPLDRTDILSASGLMADIPACNSVARWNSGTQGYDQYISLIEVTNFATRPGYPYYVNITSDVTWPSLAKGAAIGRSSENNELIEKRNAPHLVYGKIELSASGMRWEDLDFSAYFPSQPEERLSKGSAGCKIADGCYMIQCNSFVLGWRIEEALKVELKDREGQILHVQEVQLSYNPADRVEDLVIGDKRGSYLSQNVPNPFRDETVIEYGIGEDGRVLLEVYSLTGNKLKTLVNEYQQSGSYQVVWDRRDAQDQRVFDGIYIYLFRSGKEVHYKKATLIR